MNAYVVAVSLKATHMSENDRDSYIVKSAEVDNALMQQQHSVDRRALSEFNITKFVQDSITLGPGGVIGDCHYAFTLERADRGVVLLSIETLNKHSTDFRTLIVPGQLGENILTSGIDLDNLPKGTILHIGNTAKLQVTARRNFCFKFINAIGVENVQPNQRFNMNEVGVQACVLESGVIRPNDPIVVEIPTDAVDLPKRLDSIPLARFRKIPLTKIR